MTAETHADLGLIEVVAERTEVVATDVLAVDLVQRSGSPLPAWTPGAHVDLRLPSGLVRSYSLCGNNDDLARYRIAVLRVPGGRGGSNEVHTLDWGGQQSGGPHVLRISLPRNNFELVDAENYLFVAGGIGITPLLPMMRSVSAQGRPWTLHFGGRTAASMAFRDAIDDLPGGEVTYWPEDARGLIDVVGVLDAAAEHTEIYCCGPTGLLDIAQSHAKRSGAAARLHVERFLASAPTPPECEDTGFEVELRRSQTAIWIGPDETILAKVLEVNPGHPWSCEEGVCGSCETTVLEGDVDHRDDILNKEERAANDTMFICVSRCTGKRLVLDL